MDDYQAILNATGELSKLLLEDAQLETTLLGIGKLATSVIPACEEAGVTLESHGNVTARVSTGDTAEKIDSYQYDIEEGPCVAAADTHRSVLIKDMANEERWPRFSSFAAALGINSSYAIPMMLNGDMIGVLNLYSTDDAFGPSDEHIGIGFAEQAAMAVRHAATSTKTREIIRNLHRALETRDVIGAAVGIMMHRDGTPMDVAFNRLAEVSQRENLKLRDVAERIIGQFQTDLTAID